jgi:hypothetical protein
MSTHRRGARPSQWPVRDLLGPENGRARFWDARVGAAAAGLFACGAAVTVVLSSGSRAVSDQRLEAPGSPLAIPAPALAPAVPAAPPPVAPPPVAPPQVAEPQLPARVDAPRPRSARPQHRRAAPRHRTAVPAAPRHRTAVPAPSARDVPVQGDAAPQDRTLAEQVATAVDGWEGRTGPDGTVVGWLLVPVQRPADAAALLDVAAADEPCHERDSGGRHRARDRDAEQRVDRHHEVRGGRHRAPDRHREDHGGRHRAPEQDDQRSTPYRFVTDDGAGQDEADRDERERAEVRAGHADRHERDRTVHDAAQDREHSLSDDDPPSRIPMRMTPLTSGALATMTPLVMTGTGSRRRDVLPDRRVRRAG